MSEDTAGEHGGGADGGGLLPSEERDTSRLVSFSDAVFAVAITLLVLSLEIPSGLSPAMFRDQLRDIVPSITAYGFSFWVVSSFWLAHHRAFFLIRRVDERLLLLNLGLLCLVVLVPFPTQVLGDYGDQAPAIMMYAGTVGAAALLSSVLWWYASHNHRLIDPAISADFVRRLNLRGMVVAVLFLVSVPLALVSTDLPKYCWFGALSLRMVLDRRLRHAHRFDRHP